MIIVRSYGWSRKCHTLYKYNYDSKLTTIAIAEREMNKVAQMVRNVVVKLNENVEVAWLPYTKIRDARTANSIFFNFSTWNKTLDDTTKGKKIDALLQM